MAICLDEEYFGEDANEISYPHLLLCMGVTCQMENGWLIGVHITNPTTETVVLDKMKEGIRRANGRPRRLYFIGNLTVHTKHGNMSPFQKASYLKFESTVVIYNTEKLRPTDGTFARLVSKGSGDKRCDIYAVKDEMVRPYIYSRAPQPPVVQYDTWRRAWVSPRNYKIGWTHTPTSPLLNTDFSYLGIV